MPGVTTAALADLALPVVKQECLQYIAAASGRVVLECESQRTSSQEMLASVHVPAPPRISAGQHCVKYCILAAGSCRPPRAVLRKRTRPTGRGGRAQLSPAEVPAQREATCLTYANIPPQSSHSQSGRLMMLEWLQATRGADAQRPSTHL